MKYLVIGKGGREHALIKALAESPQVSQIHALPGNDGMSKLAVCHALDSQDHEQVLELVRKMAIDLVIIGPENELASGLADTLRQQDIWVVGPSREAAQLESSKHFAKTFMIKSGVPTADFKVVSSVEETLKAAEFFSPPYVLKADGLAAGKGVTLNQNLNELKKAAEDLFENKKLGHAGDQALLEEFLPGYELSFLVLTNGKSYQSLPLMQDHKRLLEEDRGPNTGGMGVVGPVQISEEIRNRIETEIIEPSIKALARFTYRGVLYIGLMMTEEGPKVVEYNVRFGDPEAQAILPLLAGDWAQVFLKLAQGEMVSLKWKPLSVACIVSAAEGYPDHPVKGTEMMGDPFYESASSYFIHAGTKKSSDEQWIVHGGRVINSIGIGKDLKEAVGHAYAQQKKLSWLGLQYRKDIGQKLLS